MVKTSELPVLDDMTKRLDKPSDGLSPERQGIIYGMRTNGKEQIFEIFDRKFKYLHATIDELFIGSGDWVKYDVRKSKEGFPGIAYEAFNVREVEEKSSNPATDDFKHVDPTKYFKGDDKRVDTFSYNINGNTIVFKTRLTIQDGVKGLGAYNSYYGLIHIEPNEIHRLLNHEIHIFDAAIELIRPEKYKGGPHFRLQHYVKNGQYYSLSGFLSILGKVCRGPRGVVRDRKRPEDIILVQSPAQPVLPIRDENFGEAQRDPARSPFYDINSNCPPIFGRNLPTPLEQRR
ncbi:unnamed protein product [Caenorhabditis bovis]|uniref:Uncharacterized protein n=1 Tax=Caenorhabditis bovis TaxID=2654633 RepID=A0A8S1F2Q6_9PELO|nr:unnamed protein product [Caenorhabditis bovis]